MADYKQIVTQLIEDDTSDQDSISNEQKQKLTKETNFNGKNEEQKYQCPPEFDQDIDYEQHQDSEIYQRPLPLKIPQEQEVKSNIRQPNPKVLRRGILQTDQPFIVKIAPNDTLKSQQEQSGKLVAQAQTEVQLNPDLIKKITAQRLRHGRLQFLYEKNSGSKAWKDYALLHSKGYGKECLQFIQFLDHRIYASIISQVIFQNQILIYKRRHTILQGKVFGFDEVQYKSKDYPKYYSDFDKKMLRKISKYIEQRQEKVDVILDYHKLELNSNLKPVILILSCEKKKDGIICTYIQCGKEFKCDMDEVEKKYPKELAFFLNDQIKKVQNKKK